MHDFRRLSVWQDGIELAAWLYGVTAGLPATETYGLVTQIRRAAVSVPANIAEGAGRGDSKDMARFLRISLGSLAELESHLAMATRLGLLSEPNLPIGEIEILRRRILRLHDRLTGERI